MHVRIIIIMMLAITAINISYADLCGDCPDNMIHYYKFEGTGDDLINNESANRFDTSNIVFNTSYYPETVTTNTQSLSCNGTSATAVTANTTQMEVGTDDFTISYWQYFPADQADAHGFAGDFNGGTDEGIRAILDSSNYRVYTMNAGAIHYGTIPDANSWTFITIRRNGTQMYLFYNGTYQTEVDNNIDVSETNYAYRLCKKSWHDSGYFNGNFDEVMMFNDARTDAEILLDMAGYGNAAADSDGPAPSNCLVNNSNPKIYDTVHFNCTWSDATGLSGWYFEDNISNTNTTHSLTWGSNDESTYEWTVNITYGINMSAKFHANDTLDNWNVSTNITILVDNTAPTITLSSPDDGYNNNSNFTVTFTPQDLDGQDLSCNLTVNGSVDASNDSITNGSVTYLTSTTVLSDGDYWWNITCSDGVTSVNSSTRNFTLDTVNPVLTINSPGNETAYNQNETNITIDISCSDSNPFLLNWSFWRDSTIYDSNQNNTPDGSALSLVDTLNISLLSDGTYYLNVSCSDSHTYGSLRNLTYDYDNGTIRFFKGIEPALKIGFDFGYYSGGEVNKVTSQQMSSFDIDSFVVEVRNEYQFGMVFDLPAADFLFGFRFPKNDNLILWDEDTAHFIWRNEYYADFDAEVCEWSGGSRSNCRSGNPTLIEGASYWYVYYNYDLKNWYDAGDRLVFYTKSIGGLNIVEQQYTLTLDSVGPVVNGTIPTDNAMYSVSNDVNFTFNITETNPDIFELWANFSGSWALNTSIDGYATGTNALEINLSVPDGYYIWQYFLNDTAGNELWSSNLSLTVDTTSPVITLISPSNTTEVYDNDVAFFYNISDISTITNCSFYLNGSLNDTDGLVKTFRSEHFNLIDIPNGTYNWNISCYDAQGLLGFMEGSALTVYDNSSVTLTSTSTSTSSGGGGGGGGSGSAAGYEKAIQDIEQKIKDELTGPRGGANLFYIFIALIFVSFIIKENRKKRRSQY